MATGITKRHSSGCNARGGGRCNCNAGYEASVFSKREGKKIRKTFAREAEAKSWRSQAAQALSTGELRSSSPTTVEQAWDAWLPAAKEGLITNRSGDPFKPSTLRSYDQAMKQRVLPVYGSNRLTDIHRPDWQKFINGLRGKFNASTITVTMLPVRALYKQLEQSGTIANSPCRGLELPAVRGRRERYATPGEAEQLIEAVAKPGDRAIWATAFYGGLRRGELRALRRSHVKLADGVIDVNKGWDPYEGEIDLKSRSGKRRVPIPAALHDFLEVALLETEDRGPNGHIFGPRKSSTFSPDKLQKRADEAWSVARLSRITLHECRHTFASLMIAAGVNAKSLQEFMGHASITITLDRYGHLMPGSEAEAASLLDSYLGAQRERAEEAARSAEASLAGA
ncbi:MAG TPA: tyrosine-type recombinase/integrase [Solirubrobacterales bacterium]